MTAIPFVGRCFADKTDFLTYLDSIMFGAWRPLFVTVHHTGGPTLADWMKWQQPTAKRGPVSDEQWMKNLASYYGNELGWSHGPHFFFTPKNFCVLSTPTVRGTHAVSFNALSWGVEMVGNFDSEHLEGELLDRYITGVACLHIALGLKPGPYHYKTAGIHFHRDDPETSKTCPGLRIDKNVFVDQVTKKILQMTGGEAPAEKVVAVKLPSSAAKVGTVTGVKANDVLNVRATASGKAAVIDTLKPGEQVKVVGRADNSGTEWLNIEPEGWVSARYIKVA